MAGRTGRLTRWPLPGLAAAAIVLVAAILPVVAVLARAGGWPTLGAGDSAALRFTLTQAALSALLSALLAVPLARALARRRFPGRRVMLVLLGVPFVLPVIVAILGLVIVFGRQGWLNDLLALAGLPRLSIYGLHGVVLAHVFLNLPLAVRLLLSGWQAIPAERFRLAASLGCDGRATFRHLEWPMLRSVLPGTLLVIFLICLSSFAVALTLGGGPRATTVELAIYQAFRFDFDLGRAAGLALIQLTLGAAAMLAALRAVRAFHAGPGLDAPLQRWDSHGPLPRALDAAILLAAALFLFSPMLAMVLRGAGGLSQLDTATASAALRSLAVALTAMTLASGLALALSLAAAGSPRAAGWFEAAGTLPLAISPFVLGTGLFLLALRLGDPLAWALPVTALVNATLALPFVLRVTLPAAVAVQRDYGPLMAALDMTGPTALLRVTLPRMRPALGFGAGLAGALSMGDLGVIALFAGPDQATLPYHLYALMGAYRMDAAAGTALLLVALSLGLFWLCDRGGGHA